MDEDFKEELIYIKKLLESQDSEINELGYNILRASKFKKFTTGKLWTSNNKSYYRFILYELPKPDSKDRWKDYHRSNRILYAYGVITSYLEGKIHFKKIQFK